MTNMWDAEVDVACIGSGSGAMANALAVVDAGGEVLVVDVAPIPVDSAAPGTLRERVHAKRGWLTGQAIDPETEEYFAAVAEGVAGPTDVGVDASVPLRVARNLSRDEAVGRVEPFVGSRLVNWASQCLVSPYGLMYTSMRDWRTTTMRSSDGDSIEVVSVGTMVGSDGDGGNALRHWMSEQTRQRGIEVRTASALQRVVFEDGAVVGVVLSTPEGPYAVRTRRGATFAPQEQEPRLDATPVHASGDPLQVCLVGRTASRFGRVELMATEPSAPPRPTCTGSRRQYREGMHETRQPSLEGWRCGKVHGYPSLGQ